MIIEGRLNNVEKKFPLLALKHRGESIIDKFGAHDPSGNNKYLMWMATVFMQLFVNDLENDSLGHTAKELGKFQEYVEKQYKRHLRGFVTGVTDWNTVNPDTVINKAEQFHHLLPYLKNKDIYSKEYQTSHEESANPFRKISDALEQAETEKNAAEEKKAMKRAKKAGARSGTEVVYENEFGATALRVHTTQAACFFGQGTRWCIAAKQGNQFESYTDEGIAFYYVLNPKHPNRDYQKFAVLFNPRESADGRDAQRPVFNSEPIPVVEIFDAADDTVSPSILLSSLKETGLLGDKVSPAAGAGSSQTVHEIFDKMMNTMAAHAAANPPAQSLKIYAERAFDERDDDAGGFEYEFRVVNEPVGGTATDVHTGLPLTKKVREKAAIRVTKPILIDLPFSIFSTLLKALVTPTGDRKLGQGSSTYNRAFYVKLRDQYIERIKEIAEEHMGEYFKDFGEPVRLREDNRKLFSMDDDSPRPQPKIKDARFSVHNEKRDARGVYRPRAGDDVATKRLNKINAMGTAFDHAMYSIVDQWGGNPNADFKYEATSAQELYKFARDRYNPSIYFVLEFSPADAGRTLGKKDMGSDGKQLYPHPVEPQFYIFDTPEKVDNYVSEISKFEELFFWDEKKNTDYARSLKRKLSQADLGSRSRGDWSGSKQQSLDFSKKDENKLFSRWKKIIKK